MNEVHGATLREETEREKFKYQRHVLAKLWEIAKGDDHAEDDYDTNNLYDLVRDGAKAREKLAAERERCAKIASTHNCEETSRCRCGAGIAAKIRSGE